MKIEQLHNVTTKALEEINAFLPQLSSSAKPLTYASLLEAVKDPAVTFLVAKDDERIIGMGILLVFHTALGTAAALEEIIVDEKYRGQGIGEKITKELIELAREQRAGHIYLTSRPSRVAANKLYEKLGFEKKETNAYHLKL